MSTVLLIFCVIKNIDQLYSAVSGKHVHLHALASPSIVNSHSMAESPSFIMSSTSLLNRFGLPKIKKTELVVGMISSSVVLLLIILSGNCERNPGPVRFPCGTCRRAVAKNHRAVSCDSCQNWFHIKCCNITANQYKDVQSNPIDEDWFVLGVKLIMNALSANQWSKTLILVYAAITVCNRRYHSSCTCISSQQYTRLQKAGSHVSWFCLTCELPNFSDSFFNSSASLADENSFSALSDELDGNDISNASAPDVQGTKGQNQKGTLKNLKSR